MENILSKLKIDSFKNLACVDIPEDLKIEFKDYKSVSLTKDHDAVIVFSTSNEDFFKTLEKLVKEDIIVDKGLLFILYPKKGNKRYPSYVHRDEIFPKVQMDDEGFIYKTAYKFNRMLGFNDEFTLLEIKKILNYKAKNQVSKQGSDYLKFIPDVEKYLEKDAEALKIYQALSPGYRKDWAVYIFSTQNESTRNKHFEECETLLKQGHKNMTLYRQSLKK